MIWRDTAQRPTRQAALMSRVSRRLRYGDVANDYGCRRGWVGADVSLRHSGLKPDHQVKKAVSLPGAVTRRLRKTYENAGRFELLDRV